MSQRVVTTGQQWGETNGMNEVVEACLNWGGDPLHGCPLGLVTDAPDASTPRCVLFLYNLRGRILNFRELSSHRLLFLRRIILED